MKMVVAIIRPEKLEAVQQALNERDVYLMTVTDVRGCGRQRGYTEVYRGTEFQVRLRPGRGARRRAARPRRRRCRAGARRRPLRRRAPAPLPRQPLAAHSGPRPDAHPRSARHVAGGTLRRGVLARLVALPDARAHP